jgi:hypothetical protein
VGLAGLPDGPRGPLHPRGPARRTAADPHREFLEAVRDAVWADGLAAVGRPGQHAGVRRQGRPGGQRRLGLPGAVRLEQLDGGGADNDAPFGVRLGVPCRSAAGRRPARRRWRSAPHRRRGRRHATSGRSARCGGGRAPRPGAGAAPAPGSCSIAVVSSRATPWASGVTPRPGRRLRSWVAVVRPSADCCDQASQAATSRARAAPRAITRPAPSACNSHPDHDSYLPR